MLKKSYIFLLFIFIFSCKSSKNQQTSTNEGDSSAILFSIETTSCMGECPVFEAKLTADSTFYFNGLKNTQLANEHMRKLTTQEYTTLSAMVLQNDWSSFEAKYKSEMLDLPTRKFFYNFDNDSITVYQNSFKPVALTSLSDSVFVFSQRIFSN